MVQKLEILNKSMSAIEPILAHAKTMSENYKAAEEAKLRRIELQLQLRASNRKEQFEREKSYIEIDSPNQENTTATLNKSIMSLQRSIEKNSQQKIYIKRNYTLDVKTSMTIWMDKLRSEVQSHDLLDVIDSTAQTRDYTVQERMKREEQVRDIILQRLDESYYSRITEIRSPVLIIQKLKELKQIESNTTHASVRCRLWKLKMNSKEKVADFFNRFDTLIREYENCEGAVPLTIEEKRSAFYNAAKAGMPKITDANLNRKVYTKEDMNMEEMRMYLLQLEAETIAERTTFENDGGVKGQANHTFTPKARNCTRCNEYGHQDRGNECPIAKYDLYFCYYCRKIGKHKGKECWSAKNTNRQKQQPSDRNKYNKGHAMGHSQSAHGNGGGKMHKSKESAHHQKPYQKHHQDSKNKKAAHKPHANKAGKNSQFYNNINEITFIADSGATEHIINKGLILSNFEKCIGEVIKSANRKRSADIEIDGRGNLFLQSNVNNRTIELTNVLAAKNITSNLISLRRFVDAGLSIYLDNKTLKVFEKTTGLEYLSGVYVKPNWLITLAIKDKLDNQLDYNYSKYSCTAKLVSLDEFLQQSQTDVQELASQDSEGADLENNLLVHPSEIGRENIGKTNQENLDLNLETNKERLCTFTLDEKTLNRKILDLNKVAKDSSLESLCVENELDTNLDKNRKITEAMLWHVKLGHPSIIYLKEMQKHQEILKNVRFENSIQECETCIMAKMEKLPFSETRKRASRPLEILHSDIMGPIKPASFPGDNRFIISFIDDFSRFTRIYSIRTKDEAGNCLEKFLQNTRNILGKNEKVCFIRADNAREFTGGKFAEIMKIEKIDNNFSPPYTPQHNGTAERFNKTLQEKIRALMFDSGLPKSMWILAAETAIHLYNRTPHKSINMETPLEKFTSGCKLHLDKIRRFGCIGYIKVPIAENKFAPRAIKAVLAGYSTTGYVLWHPTSGKFMTSRHVRFNEKLVYQDVFKSKVSSQNIKMPEDVEDENWLRDFNKDETEKSDRESQEKQEIKTKRGRPRKRPVENSNLEEETQASSRKQPSRKAKADIDFSIYAMQTLKPVKDTSFAYFASTGADLSAITFKNNCLESQVSENLIEDEVKFILFATMNKDPTSYKEAMATPEKLAWQEAVGEELRSMKDNEVWQIVDRPTSRNTNIIDSKWVFKRKTGEQGQTVFKARLVIRGFKDRNEYELKETYAPVSRMPIVRSVLAIVNKYNLEVCQMDVKTAFLNGILEEDIYMKIPEGLSVDDKTRNTKVCKLQKSLYGLRISPKKWNARFSEEARKLGLENDINEPCLFTWRKQGNMALIVLYVDDMLIASNELSKLEEIKNKLSSVFKMKDLGEPNNFLGMKITRNRKDKIMTINQQDYIERILERFNMKECKPQETPMVTRQVKNRNIRKDQDQREMTTYQESKVPYREAIGSLLYLAGSTRPDISYAVNILSRHQANPTEEDWKEVKRIFRYLRGTTNLGLTYKAKTEALEAMTDSSFRDWSDSSSTSGFIITLFGDPISWRSHKQTYVTLSTCQAEYLAMSEAGQELVSLDKAIRDITGETHYPVTIWCDNKSAGDCTEMEGSQRMKNFDDSMNSIIKYLKQREQTGNKRHMAETHGDYIKSLVIEGKVKVRWINTKENMADIMTKPLESSLHKYLTKKILNRN